MNKKIGLIIIGIGLLILGLLFLIKAREDYYINLLIENHGGSCFLDDGTCLHEDRNFLNYIFGSILSVALLVFGAYIAFFENRSRPGQITREDKTDYSQVLKGLDPEEKNIAQLIIGSDGTIFQSELAEKSGYSKVKVTRLLDRLEGKGIAERKRRGMTNVVILKVK